MSNLRLVLDTSVIVSAVLLPRSVPRQAFDAAVSAGKLMVSAATVAELDDVIRRPKFDRYISEELRLEFLAALVQQAEQIDIDQTITGCRDPKDNKFLELAVCGGASQIISGDDDLLSLHPFRGIVVITPQAFLASLHDV
jgi:putative PIN family toxin of toxin-antitoxin system